MDENYKRDYVGPVIKGFQLGQTFEEVKAAAAALGLTYLTRDLHLNRQAMNPFLNQRVELDDCVIQCVYITCPEQERYKILRLELRDDDVYNMVFEDVDFLFNSKDGVNLKLIKVFCEAYDIPYAYLDKEADGSRNYDHPSDQWGILFLVPEQAIIVTKFFNKGGTDFYPERILSQKDDKEEDKDEEESPYLN